MREMQYSVLSSRWRFLGKIGLEKSKFRLHNSYFACRGTSYSHGTCISQEPLIITRRKLFLCGSSNSVYHKSSKLFKINGLSMVLAISANCSSYLCMVKRKKKVITFFPISISNRMVSTSFQLSD